MPMTPRELLAAYAPARPNEPAERRELFLAALDRVLRSVAAALQAAGPDQLGKVVSQPTDALATVTMLAARDEDNPLAAALAEGLLVRDRILADAGGGLTTAQVATMLHLTPQAVTKARAARRLLAVEFSERKVRYPAAQFRKGKPLPGLDRVLRASRLDDSWMELEHMTTAHPGLGGLSILQALAAGRIVPAVEVMAGVGEAGL
ncbi:MAG: hypothetical protein H0T68_01655 [Gemmatimonadales bacterium]|nr:hypothetical protein [Gemmatimonadales bacterium]